jgi:prepilin-type N-terminal cleavage/methylation domain-containing protein
MAQGTGMAHATSNRRGFTLIELLVVIGIIAILIGITFAVGRSVVEGSKKNATEDTLRVLDTALQAYIQARGENPPFAVDFPDPADTNPAAPRGLVVLLAFDGTNMDDPRLRTINSVGVFLYAAQQVPEAKAVLDKLSAKQLISLDVDGLPPPNAVGNPYGEQPELPTALDAWGRPIRFVHPKGDGLVIGQATQTGSAYDAVRPVEAWLGTPLSIPGEIDRRYIYADVRRSDRGTVPNQSGDGDGGKAAGSRPYFYSAGEDGRVGYALVDGAWVNYNADNVYLSQPTFTKPPP